MVLLLTTGCSIYHPQAVDIPLLQEPGETRVDLALSLSAIPTLSGPQFNTTVSYAFGEWMSGQAHANVGGGTYYFHVAPGSYLPIGERFVLEGYAGLGFGGAFEQSGDATPQEGEAYSYRFSGHFKLPYLQINAGWRHLWIFEVAAGFKTGLMIPDFTFLEYGYEDYSQQTDYERYTTPNLLLEPQLQFRIGGKHVMFTTRLGWAWLSDIDGGDSMGSGHMVHEIFTASSGLNFTF